MFALVLVFVAVAKKKRVSEAEVEEEAATAEAPTLVGAQGKEKVFFLSYHTCVFSQRTTFYAPPAVALIPRGQSRAIVRNHPGTSGAMG